MRLMDNKCKVSSLVRLMDTLLSVDEAAFGKRVRFLQRLLEEKLKTSYEEMLLGHEDAPVIVDAQGRELGLVAA